MVAEDWEWGVGNNRFNSYWVFFWGDENVFKLQSGSICTTLEMCQMQPNYIL